eukprot:6367263-Lingulodinium_polyedra.AAC.1
MRRRANKTLWVAKWNYRQHVPFKLFIRIACVRPGVQCPFVTALVSCVPAGLSHSIHVPKSRR